MSTPLKCPKCNGELRMGCPTEKQVNAPDRKDVLVCARNCGGYLSVHLDDAEPEVLACKSCGTVGVSAEHLSRCKSLKGKLWCYGCLCWNTTNHCFKCGELLTHDAQPAGPDDLAGTQLGVGLEVAAMTMHMRSIMNADG